MFKCSECPFETTTLETFQEHLRTTHKEKIRQGKKVITEENKRKFEKRDERK